MTFFGALGALYFVLQYLPSRKFILLVASGICMFLGLMSKENAVTFLAVIPLTLFFFTNARTKDYVVTAIPSLIAFFIYLIIRTNVIGYLFNSGKKITDLMNNPFIEMNGTQKLATILYTLGQYIRLLIFPHPLTHDYYPYHIPIMDFGKPGTLISLAIYLGLAFAFFKLWKRKSIYAWAIGFYIATLSIVSNLFFPVGTFMNERFIFIPSLAFSIVTAWVLIQHGWKSDNKVLKWGSLTVLVLVMTGYIIKTYNRVPAWKDSLSLNGQAALVSTNSARNNCFMATALYEEGHKTQDAAAKKQLFEEAEYYADKSLAIYPTYLNANQIKSGLVAERYLRDGDLSKLLSEFMKILDAKAQVEYIPQFLDYLNGRAPQETMINFYYQAGYELLTKTKHEYPTAIVILKLGEKIAPNDPRILFGLGKALYLGGDQVQGTDYLSKAYQIDPSLRDLK
jgi:tetratricopeptide (TPR) repeat protein